MHTRQTHNGSYLGQHMSRYNSVDAKIDNPHAPTRELSIFVRAALDLRPKRQYRPLRRLVTA